MIEIRQTIEFSEWLGRLKLVLLLCGGDKSTQEMDIAKAKALAKESR